MSLHREIQKIMNEPVMNMDIAKLAASSGTMEEVRSDIVIMKRLDGIQAAVMRLAQEIEQGRSTV